MSNLSMSGMSTDNEPTQRGSPFNQAPFPAVVVATAAHGARTAMDSPDPYASRKKKRTKLDGL